MAKYLIQGSYSLEGHKGLLKDGGSLRREATVKAMGSVGGRVEAFYFAFGADDFVIIVDAPDNLSAAAVALTAVASGAVQSRITVLLTPEEVDQATRKSVAYRPPGL
ncbi:MAG: GYD domain-containing protein [Candidatus Eremiobacteraeota bacterium]|nr:GYD domain-containing protein [Candidatus Eremiobacteraeota bacterium]